LRFFINIFFKNYKKKTFHPFYLLKKRKAQKGLKMKALRAVIPYKKNIYPL